MRNSSRMFADLQVLARAESREAEYQARTGIQTKDGEIRLFIDDPNRRIGLILPINEDRFDSVRNDARSSAIQIRKLRGYTDTSSQTTLRLSLNDRSLLGVFTVFTDEFFEAIREPDSDAITVAYSMLSKWRRLFRVGSTSRSNYDTQKELGLLCELEVLEKLIERQGPSALDSWIGHSYSEHDFELEDRSLECKATGSANELRIHIHGPRQLRPLEGKTLDLVVRQYSLDPHGSLSVPELFGNICDLVPGRGDDLVEYIRATDCPLFDADSNYGFNRFSPHGCFEFEVVEDFPAVKQVGPETRIKNLTYVIDLSDPHSVAGFRANNIYLDPSDN